MISLFLHFSTAEDDHEHKLKDTELMEVSNDGSVRLLGSHRRSPTSRHVSFCSEDDDDSFLSSLLCFPLALFVVLSSCFLPCCFSSSPRVSPVFCWISAERETFAMLHLPTPQRLPFRTTDDDACRCLRCFFLDFLPIFDAPSFVSSFLLFLLWSYCAPDADIRSVRGGRAEGIDDADYHGFSSDALGARCSHERPL
ncbi:hypothetical protein C8R45DRAFT_117274 [Mycena sanguinolenta]|nr:hypothetical protein C8R45DRAFT_117274 [Mycena sanguinolenta]